MELVSLVNVLVFIAIFKLTEIFYLFFIYYRIIVLLRNTFLFMVPLMTFT